MADNLLVREVKSSKKGLFVYFGGWRYHPQKKTHATLGMEVKLESPFRLQGPDAVVHIGGHKEVWRQRGKPKNEESFFSKRIRLTDHCAGIRPDGGYIELVRR